MNINELVDEAYTTAVSKGWWENRTSIGECLALIHSEISEALEDYRHGRMSYSTEKGKPVGFPTELADTVIRIADLCGHLNIDLDWVLRQKMDYNKTRSYRHGGKVI